MQWGGQLPGSVQPEKMDDRLAVQEVTCLCSGTISATNMQAKGDCTYFPVLQRAVLHFIRPKLPDSQIWVIGFMTTFWLLAWFAASFPIIQANAEVSDFSIILLGGLW